MPSGTSQGMILKKKMYRKLKRKHIAKGGNMKKKAAVGLLLPIILLAGCSESNWPTQDDIEQIEIRLPQSH